MSTDVNGTDKPAGKGGRKTKSNAELEQRIEFTALLLGKALPKSVVKKQLILRYKVSARQCETYISRARALLVAWSGRSRDEHRVDSAAFWLSVIQDLSSSEQARLRARENLDKLYGLYAPVETVVKGDKDNPLRVVNVQEVIEAAQRQAADYRRARMGAGSQANGDGAACRN